MITSADTFLTPERERQTLRLRLSWPVKSLFVELLLDGDQLRHDAKLDRYYLPEPLHEAMGRLLSLIGTAVRRELRSKLDAYTPAFQQMAVTRLMVRGTLALTAALYPDMEPWDLVRVMLGPPNCARYQEMSGMLQERCAFLFDYWICAGGGPFDGDVTTMRFPPDQTPRLQKPDGAYYAPRDGSDLENRVLWYHPAPVIV